jgi:hypothetical protein
MIDRIESVWSVFDSDHDKVKDFYVRTLGLVTERLASLSTLAKAGEHDRSGDGR